MLNLVTVDLDEYDNLTDQLEATNKLKVCFQQELPHTKWVVIPKSIRDQIVSITRVDGENEDLTKAFYLIQLGVEEDITDEECDQRLNDLKQILTDPKHTTYITGEDCERECPLLFSLTRLTKTKDTEKPPQISQGGFGRISIERY